LESWHTREGNLDLKPTKIGIEQILLKNKKLDSRFAEDSEVTPRKNSNHNTTGGPTRLAPLRLALLESDFAIFDAAALELPVLANF